MFSISWDPKFTLLIPRSQGKTATLIGFPALLVDSGHKNSAKAHQVNLLDLLLLAMLDFSHINAWKDQQAPVNKGISIPSLPVLQSYKRVQVTDTIHG